MTRVTAAWFAGRFAEPPNTGALISMTGATPLRIASSCVPPENAMVVPYACDESRKAPRAITAA